VTQPKSKKFFIRRQHRQFLLLLKFYNHPPRHCEERSDVAISHTKDLKIGHFTK
jgi:hypothetical protein